MMIEKAAESRPEEPLKSDPIDKFGRYVPKVAIVKLGVEKYQKQGRGITFRDVLENHYASKKETAQEKIKRAKRVGILFTLTGRTGRKPQEYYPTSLRAEILKEKSTNLPHRGNPKWIRLDENQDTIYSEESLDSPKLCSLIDCLRILPADAHLAIHNLRLRILIPADCYDEIKVARSGSLVNAKQSTYPVGSRRFSLIFYPSGSIDLQITCSRNPYPLTLSGIDSINQDFGEIRGIICNLLVDPHHHYVPPIGEWHTTQIDMNVDIRVASIPLESLKLNASAQWKYYKTAFRAYLKPIDADLYLRVETTQQPRKPLIEVVHECMTLAGALKRVAELERRCDVLENVRLVMNKPGSVMFPVAYAY